MTLQTSALARYSLVSSYIGRSSQLQEELGKYAAQVNLSMSDLHSITALDSDWTQMFWPQLCIPLRKWLSRDPKLSALDRMESFDWDSPQLSKNPQHVNDALSVRGKYVGAAYAESPEDPIVQSHLAVWKCVINLAIPEHSVGSSGQCYRSGGSRLILGAFHQISSCILVERLL